MGGFIMVNSIKITDYITEDLIDLDLKSKNRDEILVELSKLLEKSDNIVGKENDILKALVDREKLGSTGIGKGVAIPHAKTESAKSLAVAFGVSRKGVDFNSLDEEDVHLFFVFALSISLLFVITFIVLFIQYTIIYERVSHNFKAVEHG